MTALRLAHRLRLTGFRCVAIVMGLSIALSTSPRRAYAVAGDLDATFGSGGTVTTTIGSSYAIAHAAVVQSDGKIVAAGVATNAGNEDFAVARYNTDGTLDTSFGSAGTVTTAIGSGSDVANALVVQSDGKLVAAGYTFNGSSSDFAIVRYNANGSLDSSFGSGGKVTVFIGSNNDAVNALVLQSDGKLVAAGYTLNGSGTDFALVRLTTTGSVDSTFGLGGVVTTAIGASSESINGLVLQPDGKLVAAGNTFNGANNDFALVRYTSTGALDSTFGSGGKVTTAVGSSTDIAYALLRQSDGKLVAAGYSLGATSDVALVRYTTSGSLDGTFGSAGKVITDFSSTSDSADAVVLQSDGKLVAAGGSAGDFALARYNTTGSLDNAFGNAGKVTTSIGSGADLAYALVLQADGKLVAVGSSSDGTTTRFALARYLGVALPTSTPTLTPTSTFTDTPTPTATNTSTPTASETPTHTMTATASTTPTPSPTSTATSSPSVTVTPTEAPSETPTSTLTATSTSTPTATDTASSTPTHTSTWTPTPTQTLTQTSTATQSWTPTMTPTDTLTATPTASPTYTRSLTPTSTVSPSSTASNSPAPSPTATSTPTSTTTATRSPTATESPTVTSSASPTPSATPSITATPAPVCGNGILEIGEQCDDGNIVNGDGCRADCTYELIPGNGNGSAVGDRHACLLEFSVVNPNNAPATDLRGRPNFIQKCANNDPTCDFDLDANDHACEFHVVACLNNLDPNLPSCAPLGVAAPLTVTFPSARRDPLNYGVLTAALQNLRNAASGATGLAAPIAVTDTNLCSAPFTIRVPPRGTTRFSAGRVRLLTRAKSLVAVPRVVGDRDRVTLICMP